MSQLLAIWMKAMAVRLPREKTMTVSNSGHDVGAGMTAPISGKVCDPPHSCPACVKASALAAELTEEQLRMLFDELEVRRLSKNEVLISEGEYDDRLYAIASGQFEICRGGDSGREVVLHSFGPGNITGELAFLDGLTRTAMVRAASDEDSCVVCLHALGGSIARIQGDARYHSLGPPHGRQSRYRIHRLHAVRVGLTLSVSRTGGLPPLRGRVKM
jgi:hypothetical protein